MPSPDSVQSAVRFDVRKPAAMTRGEATGAGPVLFDRVIRRRPQDLFALVAASAVVIGSVAAGFILCVDLARGLALAQGPGAACDPTRPPPAQASRAEERGASVRPDLGRSQGRTATERQAIRRLAADVNRAGSSGDDADGG